jgi:hypothetical protein
LFGDEIDIPKESLTGKLKSKKAFTRFKECDGCEDK